MGINFLHEILLSLKYNKIRSILAGFGVAWGIFILIILLGTGKGFQQGIMQLFGAFAKNSIWVYGGQISDNSKINVSTSRKILFTSNDIDIIKKRFSAIEAISPELNYNGYVLVCNQQNSGYFQVKGVLGDYFRVKTIKPEEGRLLNILDNNENRRVALIGRQVADGLFTKTPPLNQFIDIGGTYYKVVGVIDKGSIFTQREQNVIYIPCNTFIECFNQGLEFNAFMVTLSKKTNTSDFEKNLRNYLAHKYGFDQEDKKALFILNFETQVNAFNKLFKGVDLFLWFIGLCLLLSGIVGISNIMLVIVKERTFEIGIRKAIGAKSKTIIAMIISESVIITSLAGIIGLFFGGMFIVLINWVVASFFTSKDSIFTRAEFDLPVILFSLFLLILTGILAGLLPAKKAAEISPVEAIRYESR